MIMKRLIKLFTAFIALFLIAMIVMGMATYTVKENEYKVLKQFGKIVEINDEAGLYFKIPFVQSVSTISKSLQFYDLPESEVITSDKKNMIANAYILWEVTDPKLFVSSLNANLQTAEGRIDVIAYNAIKTTISNMTQEDIIASRTSDTSIELNNSEVEENVGVEITPETEGKDETGKQPQDVVEEGVVISEQLMACIGDQCDQLGIQIKDIQIKILDLPDENKNAVYDRMITERNNIAAAYTAEGNAEAQIIHNSTDKEISVMKSTAQAEAQKILAEGEAEYMKTLSEAYNDEGKAEFYLFIKSLNMAKESLKNNTTLFLGPDSPIAQIFGDAEGLK